MRARRGAALLAAALGACLVLGACGSSSKSTSSTKTTAASTLTRDFAVLHTAAEPDDALPGQAASNLEESSEPGFSAADVRASRRVLALSQAWLLPSVEGKVLCLVFGVHSLQNEELSYRTTCDPLAKIFQGHMLESRVTGNISTTHPPARVIGVVPDGVSSVIVKTHSGARVTAPVTRNAYEVVVRDPVSLTFTRQAGGKTESHTVPFGTIGS